MKSDLKAMARRNGQQAKIKAGRVAVMLRLAETNRTPGQGWLRQEAAHLAKSVSYHLRQASLIGQLIDSIERGERPNRTPGAHRWGADGKA
mgnify:CR=1 FL=1